MTDGIGATDGIGEPGAAALADDLVDAIATEMPVEATFVGLPGYDHELPDLSPEARKRLRDRVVRIAEQAAASTDPDRVTLAVVAQQADALLARVDARTEEFVVADPLMSEGAKLLAMLPQLEPSGAQAEEDYLVRLAAVPAFYRALADRHRDGLAAGRA